MIIYLKKLTKSVNYSSTNSHQSRKLLFSGFFVSIMLLFPPISTHFHPVYVDYHLCIYLTTNEYMATFDAQTKNLNNAQCKNYW